VCAPADVTSVAAFTVTDYRVTVITVITVNHSEKGVIKCDEQRHSLIRPFQTPTQQQGIKKNSQTQVSPTSSKNRIHVAAVIRLLSHPYRALNTWESGT
jgi:hypothetical protein